MDLDLDNLARSCYYAVLGVRRNASASEIRSSYIKQARKWHPDKWTKDPAVAAEAKQRFQRIQEAYSVLSDNKKRSMYDIGLYDPFEEEEEEEGFADFMEEMMAMMDKVRPEKEDTFEDLQRMFAEIVDGDGGGAFAAPASFGGAAAAQGRVQRTR
ncbi:uncharacterized protein LOC144709581 [Wolffia australiana]